MEVGAKAATGVGVAKVRIGELTIGSGIHQDKERDEAGDVVGHPHRQSTRVEEIGAIGTSNGGNKANGIRIVVGLTMLDLAAMLDVLDLEPGKAVAMTLVAQGMAVIQEPEW